MRLPTLIGVFAFSLGPASASAQVPNELPPAAERLNVHPRDSHRTPLIPRSILFGNLERDSPPLSPDGRKLAYLAPDKGVLNVWVRTIRGTDDRVVTTDRKSGISFYAWPPASADYILYIQDRDGDENWHLYRTDLRTRETVDLTPFPKVQAQRIAMDSNVPDAMLIDLNRRDPKLHDVYRLNLKTGDLKLDTENPGDVAAFCADHDLQVRLAMVIVPGGGTEIRARDKPGSPWRALVKWGPEESLGRPVGFSPNNTAAWITTSIAADALRLVEYDLATGTSHVLASGSPFDVSRIMTQPKTHELEAVMVVRERRQWMLLDRSLESDFAALHRLRTAISAWRAGTLLTVRGSCPTTSMTVRPPFTFTSARPARQTFCLRFSRSSNNTGWPGCFRSHSRLATA